MDDRDALKDMFPNLSYEDALKALENYRKDTSQGRDWLAQFISQVPMDDFEKVHAMAVQMYKPGFEEIKRMTYGRAIGLAAFDDIVAKHKVFPMLPATGVIQEIFSLYHFWLNGEKVYSIHQNLCQRFTATSIKSIPIELFEMPFPSFKMLIPDGVLPSITFQGKTIFIKEIIVTDYIEEETNQRVLMVFHRRSDDIGFFKITLDSDEVHVCVDKSVQHMIEFTQIKTGDINDEFTEAQQKLLREAFEFTAKCVLYITGANSDVQWFDETGDIKAQLARAKSGGKRKKLERRLEKARKMFLVGHRIVISREERMMYDNIAKGLWKVSYRFIVQGHYRHQPYGEGRAQRKLIYIDPFWKGPDYAEIVNNPHLLK